MISHSTKWVLACCSTLALTFCLGCIGEPAAVEGKPADADAASKRAMELFDTNKDSKISGAELDKAPGLKASLAILGAKDGNVTSEKIAARIKAWNEFKVFCMAAVLTIKHNGAPLANADVKLVPEKFLSDYLPTATGKTDSTGRVSLSREIPPGSDLPPGIQPGIYRIEITKSGESIPAKYNTETILGKEFSQDTRESTSAAEFDLKY